MQIRRLSPIFFILLSIFVFCVSAQWNIPTVEELAELRHTYSKETLKNITRIIPRPLISRSVDTSSVTIYIDQWLGGGSYGDVFNSSFGTKYPHLTAKLIKGIKDEQRIKDLYDEAIIQNSISSPPHPNVLPIALVSYCEEQKAIVYTPYMANKCLNTYIEYKRYHEEPIDGMRIVQEIFDGLHHIHQKGYVHNDMYAKNIFVNGEERIAIADFGLATSLNVSSRLRDIQMSIDLIKELAFNETIPNRIIRKQYENVINHCDGITEANDKCTTEYLSKKMKELNEDINDAHQHRYVHEMMQKKVQVNACRTTSGNLNYTLGFAILIIFLRFQFL